MSFHRLDVPMPFEPNLHEEEISVRIPVTESDVIQRTATPSEQVEAKIEVLHSSVAIAIEFAISGGAENAYGTVLHLTPAEARELSSALQDAVDGNESDLIGNLAEDMTQAATKSLATELQIAADMASGASLTGEFGENLINMYDSGQMTVSDLIGEFGDRARGYYEQFTTGGPVR